MISRLFWIFITFNKKAINYLLSKISFLASINKLLSTDGISLESWIYNLYVDKKSITISVILFIVNFIHFFKQLTSHLVLFPLLSLWRLGRKLWYRMGILVAKISKISPVSVVYKRSVVKSVVNHFCYSRWG